MKEEMKIKLFEKMLEIEHLSFKCYNPNEKDEHNYVEQSNGAFEMFKILGIDDEYIKWSDGKL